MGKKYTLAEATKLGRTISLDIETLGTTPGSSILSIGMTNGRMHGYMVIDPRTFGTKSYETVRWWRSQPNGEKFIESANSGMVCKDALRQLGDYFAEFPFDFVVTKGHFDVPLLDAAFAHHDMTPPWEFRQLVDLRSLLRLVPIEVARPTNLQPHHALWDAQYQHMQLEAILTEIDK